MTVPQPSLLTRPDTLFGVCEALGQDFGFHPSLLRVTLAVLLLWNPVAIVGIYAAAGIMVAASRLLFPNPRLTAPAAEAAAEGNMPVLEAEPLKAAA